MSKRVAMSEKPTTVHGDDNLSMAPTTEGGDKGSSRYADSEAGVTHKSELAKAERRLVMKLGMSTVLSVLTLDAGILPFAVLLYLSAYLDRGNLANARLQGLQAEVLDGSDNNYSIGTSRSTCTADFQHLSAFSSLTSFSPSRVRFSPSSTTPVPPSPSDVSFGPWLPHAKLPL